MRLWSIHPKYLDTKGLIALWRETLLAKKVLQNRTKGYKNHPQLIRFKKLRSPLVAINIYLEYIYRESISRGFNFNKTKINFEKEEMIIPVNSGQIRYEFEHLKKKIRIRDLERYKLIKDIKEPELHPIFEEVPGNIENWEIVN